MTCTLFRNDVFYYDWTINYETPYGWYELNGEETDLYTAMVDLINDEVSITHIGNITHIILNYIARYKDTLISGEIVYNPENPIDEEDSFDVEEQDYPLNGKNLSELLEDTYIDETTPASVLVVLEMLPTSPADDYRQRMLYDDELFICEGISVSELTKDEIAEILKSYQIYPPIPLVSEKGKHIIRRVLLDLFDKYVRQNA